ncbi:MAG: epoxyqueuosine reductase QueH [Proteobacteria bacterium]|nr:epoxyqueuosine reductase QueH [Pseudomonadota bacterium]
MSDIKLVLLSCCAPCSAGAIRQLAGGADLPLQNGETVRISDGIVLFYNPNIFPESEYQKRLAEQIRLCDELGVKYAVVGAENYEKEHLKWRGCVRGLESEPERGKRCSECFQMRFETGAKWARDHGYNAIASVFGVSRWKNQAQVDAAAESVVGQPCPKVAFSMVVLGQTDPTRIVYLPIRWDESIRVAANRDSNFYRQNYCGCEFSIRKSNH